MDRVREIIEQNGYSMTRFAKRLKMGLPTLKKEIDRFEHGQTLKTVELETLFQELFNHELSKDAFEQKLNTYSIPEHVDPTRKNALIQLIKKEEDEAVLKALYLLLKQKDALEVRAMLETILMEHGLMDASQAMDQTIGLFVGTRDGYQAKQEDRQRWINYTQEREEQRQAHQEEIEQLLEEKIEAEIERERAWGLDESLEDFVLNLEEGIKNS